MDNMPDVKALVEKAKNYDSNAFGKLYDVYYDKIYAFAYYKVGNRFEAEDIAEQVFLKALENISAFEWRGVPFSSWLFRIASNLVVDYYRSGKYELVDIDGHADLELDFSFSPEQSAIRELDRQQVVRALKNLTEEQQQVIAMRFIAGMSNEEVASAIDKNIGAVKALQHRALNALNKMLGGIYDGSRY